VAEVQVSAWQAAYRGILQPQFLDELSLEAREESWREVIAGGGVTLVAEDADGSAGGFCSLVLPSRDDDAGERTAEIAATYVVPGRWLTHSEWEDVTLWVFRRNAQGRAFYARSGFRLDGEIRPHQPSGVPTARMRLPLVDTL